jgi:nitrate reductase delta subunit
VDDNVRPDDLKALDAAWEEAAVTFGPGEALDGCSRDRLAIRMRAVRRTPAAPA